MSDIVDDAERAIAANEADCLRKVINRSPESNDSGLCLVCDEEISEIRLLHLPKANNCLTCQTNLEYQLKQAKRF